MGETVELQRLSFNRSVAIEARQDNQSSDAGLLLMREVLERAGVFDHLAAHLDDPRDQSRVTHPLADQLRTLVGLLAQGWNDLADADGQRGDPLLQVAASGTRGLTPLDQAPPSQPTLSRLLATLATDANRGVLHEAALKLAGQRLRAANRGHRRRRLTLDFDGMAISTAGHQAGSAYNGPLRRARLLSADRLDRRDRRPHRGVAARGPGPSRRRCT